VDKTKNTVDAPHDYVELKTPVKTRYLKLTNYHIPDGAFALTGWRIFGNSGEPSPSEVQDFKLKRQEDDKCIVRLRWTKTPDAVGYNIRYGTEKDKLYHNHQVFGIDSLTIRSLDSSRKYFFTIDAFNEGGLTKGKNIVELK
jgi:hypothetical protein